MVTYYVGDEDEHLVDHPPMFACREHKKMLRLSTRFVNELIASGLDVMPGNPQEIAGSYLKEAEAAFRLPEFLIPPKVILYNPGGLRGAEALPYATILVDKRFFGIPARYLTPDRFDGCDSCKNKRRRARPPSQVGGQKRRRTKPPSSDDIRRPNGAAGSGRRRPHSPEGGSRPPSSGGKPRRRPH